MHRLAQGMCNVCDQETPLLEWLWTVKCTSWKMARTKHCFLKLVSNVETCIWHRKCPTKNTICSCQTTSTRKVTRSGFSSRYATLKPRTRSGSTSWITRSLTRFLTMAWRCPSTVTRRVRDRTWGGTKTAKIFATFKMAFAKMSLITARVTTQPRSLTLLSTMMTWYTLLTRYLTRTATCAMISARSCLTPREGNSYELPSSVEHSQANLVKSSLSLLLITWRTFGKERV